MVRAAPVDNDTNKMSIASQANLHLIFIPIDQQGNRQDEDVYVPEIFLETLQRSQSDSSHDDARYVILGAVYRGGLRVDPQNKRVESDPWTFTLTIESFLSGCVLHLPFQRGEANWLKDSHRLDGIPIQLDWNPDGNGCAVKLDDVGMHRLELSAQPKIISSPQSSGLRLHIPRVSGSLLDLSAPTRIDGLQIVSAGSINVDDAGNRWRATLSPTDTLQLNWAPARSTDLSDLVENVEQLSWLHVEPSVARLDVQLRIHATADVPRILQLEVSPHLKLLPVDESSPVDQVEAMPNDPSLLNLKLKPGLGSQVRIPLEFQLQRTLSLGRLSFPRVRLKGVSPSRSLFAVSVSSGLSYDESLNGDARGIAVKEFTSEWGTVETLPLYAYSLGDEYPDWSLRIWPDPNSFSARQTMRVNCRRGSARVNYEAAVDGVVGNWLSHRLKVSPQLQIQAVSVSRQPEMDAVPLRWSRPNPSEVVVFFGQPLNRPHIVSLRGYVKPSASGELSLPTMALEGADRGEISLDLYREADVVVTWVDRDQAPVEVQQPGRTRGSADVLVGRYAWRASDPSDLGKIRIEKNDQRFEVETVTTVDFGPQGWSATLHGRVHVLQGVVSHLKIAAANIFQGPYLIQPASSGVVGEVRDTADGREITLLLSKPVRAGEEFDVHLTGGLGLSGDQRLEVPQLRLVGAKQAKRYVLLPTRIDWTIGLERESLPQELARFVKTKENMQSFRVELDHFSAQERSYQGPLPSADVRYAIISSVLDAQGHLTATADLVLQPGRASHCMVRLPPHSQMLQLIASDQPVRRDRVGPRSWRIPLGPPFMPRRIKIAYVAKVDNLGASMELMPPEILIGDQSLPLPQTFWKIRPVGGLRLGHPVVGTSMGYESFAEAAYRLSLQTLEDASSLALELPLREGRAWFRSWKQHTRHAWNHWRSIDTWAGEITDPAGSSFESVAMEEMSSGTWSVLEKKLGGLPNDRGQSVATYPPRLPLQSTSLLASEEDFFTSNPSGQLVLRLLPSAGGNVWLWLAAVAMTSGGLALAQLFRGRPDLRDLPWRWPHAMALVAGLAWWMLLKPSVVGLLVVTLTMASLAGRRWRILRKPIHHDTTTQVAVRTI